LSALLCIALASVPAPCVDFQCASAGAACAATATSPCGLCQSNGLACVSANFGNTTALCNCFTVFGNCVAGLGPYCGSTVYGGYVECVSLGLSCCGNPPASIPFVNCHTPTTFCNQTSGNCQTITKNGFCNSDDQCGDPAADTFPIFGNLYSCIGSTCTYNPNFPPGAPCAANSDCFSGVCTSGACVGTAIGGNCVSSLDCVAGAYCGSGSTCTAQVAVGGDCSSAPLSSIGSACAFGAICDAGTCVAFTSKANGASCITDEECVLGNVCFQGTCTTPAPVKTCTNDTDCQGNSKYAGECQCNPVDKKNECVPATSQDLLSPCASQGTTLNNCVKSKGCDPRLVGINCCNNEANCLFNCELNASGEVPFLCTNLPSCTSTTTKSAAVAVQVSFFLAAVAVVLALIF